MRCRYIILCVFYLPLWAGMEGGLQLVEYAKNGALDGVKTLIFSKEDGVINYGYPEDALIYAVKNGHLAVVEFLLQQGVDVHAKDDRALEVAIESKHFQMCEVLLKGGACSGWLIGPITYSESKDIRGLRFLHFKNILVHRKVSFSSYDLREKIVFAMGIEDTEFLKLLSLQINMRKGSFYKEEEDLFGWGEVVAEAIYSGYLDIAQSLFQEAEECRASSKRNYYYSDNDFYSGLLRNADTHGDRIESIMNYLLLEREMDRIELLLKAAYLNCSNVIDYLLAFFEKHPSSSRETECCFKQHSPLFCVAREICRVDLDGGSCRQVIRAVKGDDRYLPLVILALGSYCLGKGRLRDAVKLFGEMSECEKDTSE